MNEDPHIKISMVSQARYLAGARSMVAAVAQRMGFAEQACGQIALALDEALCNVIKHGYAKKDDGQIWISIWPIGDDPPGIRILIEDEGCQVDPAAIQSRDLAEIRPGGLGVFIIRQIMDQVTFKCREDKGMSLLMEKYVAPLEDAATGKECA